MFHVRKLCPDIFCVLMDDCSDCFVVDMTFRWVMEGNAGRGGWTYTSNVSLVNGRCNDKRRQKSSDGNGKGLHCDE